MSHDTTNVLNTYWQTYTDIIELQITNQIHLVYAVLNLMYKNLNDKITAEKMLNYLYVFFTKSLES